MVGVVGETLTGQIVFLMAQRAPVHTFTYDGLSITVFNNGSAFECTI